ncbi:hypothetical protein F5144DRAFT_236570 [Chaetomium tenue]|uniref:Uncharacterized protein n=1 Tax=Chaetomium tenue TaxID=1854479 RepID=A0ACB7P911_9PEZI|nr:hypothetical protein F5144DRAFT_236570 [Chaetomium globosum]
MRPVDLSPREDFGQGDGMTTSRPHNSQHGRQGVSGTCRQLLLFLLQGCRLRHPRLLPGKLQLRRLPLLRGQHAFRDSTKPDPPDWACCMQRRQTQHRRSSSMHAVPQCSEYSHRLNKHFSGDGTSTAPPEASPSIPFWEQEGGGGLAGYAHPFHLHSLFLMETSGNQKLLVSRQKHEFAEHQTNTPCRQDTTTPSPDRRLAKPIFFAGRARERGGDHQLASRRPHQNSCWAFMHAHTSQSHPRMQG